MIVPLASGDKSTQARAVARKTGLGRRSFHKALSLDGNPTLATVLEVVRALGVRLNAEPESGPAGESRTGSRLLPLFS